jgi:hypothetical protein
MSAPDPRLTRLIMPVAGTIVLSFTASLGYALLANQYTPLTLTTPLMILLAGAVFGINITKGKNGD